MMTDGTKKPAPPSVGDRIVRISNDSYNGTEGGVCEVDLLTTQRIRVQWAERRTWLSLHCEGKTWRRG